MVKTFSITPSRNILFYALNRDRPLDGVVPFVILSESADAKDLARSSARETVVLGTQRRARVAASTDVAVLGNLSLKRLT